MRWLRRLVEPDPTHLSVDGAAEEPVRVRLRRRGAARRMTLRVSAVTGEVALTLPEGASLATARLFLDSHKGWIAARLARRPDRVPLALGEMLPFRGEPHRIAHGGPSRAPTRPATGASGEALIVVSGDEAGIPGRVRRFLHGEAQRDLRAAVARHSAALGVEVRRVTLRDTRSRWGSCSSAGSLSFSWRLILAPPEVLDYLAAHEVAHLREMNHSQRFWRLLRDLCPATDRAERWLKQHGNALHRYG